MFSGTCDCCGGCGVASIGIHHHRYTHRSEKCFRDFSQQCFAGRHVAATDEDRRVPEIRRTACEYQTVYQPCHIVRGYGTVGKQLLDVGIHRSHLIKGAGKKIRIKLGKNGFQLNFRKCQGRTKDVRRIIHSTHSFASSQNNRKLRSDIATLRR